MAFSRNLATLFLLLFLSSHFSIAQDQQSIFRLNVESFLSIMGSSNINKFECLINGENLKDTVDIVYQANGHALDFEKFRIELEVDHFDCKNSLITSDFKKTLKAAQYPIMTIDFIRIMFPENDDPFSELYPTGIFAQVNLASRKKKYYMSLEKESLEGEMVRLKGALAVDMRDFGLEPPTKMLSLVKVNPLLDIRFELSMSRIISE